MSRPSTWREPDESAVPFPDAEEEWAVEARAALLDTARVYRATVTYKQLGEAVQARTGVRTRVLLMNWIGGVLERVAQDCASRGEPCLTALCVRADGTVGPGYAGAIEATRGVRPDDADDHAAQERMDCHRFFGAELPSDGGRARLTEQVQNRRRRPAPAAREREATTCPTCFTLMPLSGTCENCG